jgi:hypothetical protein
VSRVDKADGMKLLHAPRVKLKVQSPKRIKSSQAMEGRVATSISGAKGNQGFKMIRRSQQAKNY